MSVMTFPVEYSAALERHPQLLEAAKRGTAYFEGLYQDAPKAGDPEPILMKWELRPGVSGDTLDISFSERYESDQKEVEYNFPARQLLDQVSCEIHMLRLWRRVLTSRSNAIGRRMAEALAVMEREEEENGR